MTDLELAEHCENYADDVFGLAAERLRYLADWEPKTIQFQRETLGKLKEACDKIGIYQHMFLERQQKSRKGLRLP